MVLANGFASANPGLGIICDCMIVCVQATQCQAKEFSEWRLKAAAGVLPVFIIG
jgi:hypothetical protein